MQCTLSSVDYAILMNRIDDFVIRQCKGIPRQNWTSKCVILHNAIGVVVAIGIYCHVSSDVVVGSSRPLADTPIAIQISSIHFEDDVLDQ